MSKILLVEDNPKYASSAEQYLASRSQAVALAKDYSQAMDRLRNPDFDGVISDCFFPETTGSGNTAVGKELIERMAKSDSRERKMVEGLEVLGQYVDLEDQDMRKYARFLIGTSQERDISQSPVVRVVKQVSMLGKEAATMIAKNTLGMVYRENQAPKDYYGALMKAIEESEANQPLGLLVAEKADELSLPLVLATSTHHHDILTQPVQDYASSKGWRLVDCGPNREDDKASPEFWERAFGELERKLR
ncbi:MAG: response regulator [Nanoarchaeota archaeon]|nr:response regulator [Nanoarchaeota archaeon]MBU1631975.1 response regulator [Nanoarchaeota archaeon]MBU1876085.1 response regulator [Nanoarchaeota archaeon]